MSDISPTTAPRPRSYSAILLALILVAAAFVRFHGIDTDSLWADELMSLQYSNGYGRADDVLPRDMIVDHVIAPTKLQYARPITQIIPAMSLDTHPPLYAMLLRVWRALFGEDAIAARSLSAMWSALAVLFLYLTLKESAGQSPALWAGSLLSIAASQVEFAHEIRSYAMLLTMILACCWIVIRIEKRGAMRARCITLAILLIASMLTHYYAAPPLAALALYAMLRLRPEDRKKVAITIAAAAAIWCLAWGPFFWKQRPNFVTNMQWTREDPAGHVGKSFTRAVNIPVRMLIAHREIPILITILSAAVLILPMTISRSRRNVLLWWLMLVFSVGTVLTVDLIRTSYLLDLLRYSTAASAAVCALIAILFVDPNRRWVQVLPAAILIATLFALPAAYEKVRPDFRAMGDYLSTDLKSEGTLVIVEPTDAAWMSDVLYLAATHYMDRLPARVVVLTKPADGPLLSDLKSVKQMWVINARRGTNAVDFLPGRKIN